MRRLLLCLLVAGVVTVGFARGASAYPQFQFSSGTNKCSQCHYAPAGGGLLSSWGRSESGDTISMGGDGAFLHGAVTLPSWIALGFDLRLAGTRSDDGGQESPRTRVLPDAGGLLRALRVQRRVFAVRRGRRARRGSAGVGIQRYRHRPDQRDFGTAAERFISREHYFMWRPSATGPYARLGRFYAPYGIRFVEHIYFVRRYTGYELYNETYNLSGGYVADDWELHVSAFTPPPSSFPDPLQSVGARESGGAGYFEKRLGDMAALAPQAARRRRQGGRAATRAGWSASCGSSRPSCCSWARPTSSASR